MDVFLAFIRADNEQAIAISTQTVLQQTSQFRISIGNVRNLLNRQASNYFP